MNFAFENRRESNPRGSKPTWLGTCMARSAVRLCGYTTKRGVPTCSQTRRLTCPRGLNLWWILHLRYRGNWTHAGANPHLIRSAILTIRPTKYMRLVPNVPSHVIGTLGTNGIYSFGRMVKVADRMRWGFTPAWVRFPPYLKCKIHHNFSREASLRGSIHLSM